MRVTDGDTLHVVDATLEDHTIRMAHIDVPDQSSSTVQDLKTH